MAKIGFGHGLSRTFCSLSRYTIFAYHQQLVCLARAFLLLNKTRFWRSKTIFLHTRTYLYLQVVGKSGNTVRVYELINFEYKILGRIFLKGRRQKQSDIIILSLILLNFAAYTAGLSRPWAPGPNLGPWPTFFWAL